MRAAPLLVPDDGDHVIYEDDDDYVFDEEDDDVDEEDDDDARNDSLRAVFRLTYNGDIFHVGSRDLLADLLYQLQDESHVVRLAALRVDIPVAVVSIRSHDDALLAQEVPEAACISVTSSS